MLRKTQGPVARFAMQTGLSLVISQQEEEEEEEEEGEEEEQQEEQEQEQQQQQQQQPRQALGTHRWADRVY